ncbi:peptidoglycan recognition protein 1-like isoform X1 [Schistocerca serialis cubense]|uniref:peptidoglycan recognition protein 1-like isoform X1 n=1 Tax=Schistocerca serialis cubense TaxID=2023355 RepID=UPI00214E5BCF|nr:peptidoglycan recognition protein 1-like isoform X1 [Schistocerca serialis cubense]
MEAPDGARSIGKGTQSSSSATDKHVPWWRRRDALVLAACLTTLAIVILIVIITLTTAQASDAASEHNHTENSTEVSVDAEFILPDGRPIIRRSEWSSVPPDFRRTLRHPTPYVIIGHTADKVCRGKDECFVLLRIYRDEHRAKWLQPDISYNFLIDVEGNVYEGRGWDSTNNYQSWAKRCNLGVTLMGDFRTDNVTTTMMQTLLQLLDLGLSLGKLDPNYRLVAQSQVHASLSPGNNVLKVIDTWPHRCLYDCNVGVQCIYEDNDEIDA